MHEGFDPSGISLKTVHVETVGGTVYVCLAEEAPDFAPYREALEPYLRPHDLGNARLAHEAHVVENANWKLVMENSRECYHCAARHPELMRTFLDNYPAHDPEEDPAIAAYWQMCRKAGLLSGQANGDDFRISRLPFTEGAVSITMDGKPAVSRLLGNVPHGDIGSLRWVHYPSVFNHVLGDYAIAVRMLPLAPEQTLVTAKWIVHRDAKEGRDYDLQNLIRVAQPARRQLARLPARPLLAGNRGRGDQIRRMVLRDDGGSAGRRAGTRADTGRVTPRSISQRLADCRYRIESVRASSSRTRSSGTYPDHPAENRRG